MHLGEELKNYRRKRNLTQDQMASDIGVGFRTYQQIEKTGKVAKADTMQRIQSLGIDTQKNAHVNNNNDSVLQNDVEIKLSEYIALLKRMVEKEEAEKERLINHTSFLERMLESNLNTVLERMDRLHYHDLAYHQTMLRSLARLEPGKSRPDLIAEADKVESSFVLGVEADNPVAADT